MKAILRALRAVTEYVHFIIAAIVLSIALKEGVALIEEHAHDLHGRLIIVVLLAVVAISIPIGVETMKRFSSKRASTDPYPDVDHVEIENKPYRISIPATLAEATEAYHLVHQLFRRFHFADEVEIENFRRNKYSLVVVKDSDDNVVGCADLFCIKEDALIDLLQNRITEPLIDIKHLDHPTNQRKFYIGALAARPFAVRRSDDEPEYLTKKKKEWIAKSLVFGMAKMIDRCYLRSDVACGATCDSVTLYALGYRRSGERWLKLAGFDLLIPGSKETFKRIVLRLLNFICQPLGVGKFGKLLGNTYPAYRLVINSGRLRRFLRNRPSLAEGVRLKFLNGREGIGSD